MTKLATIYIPFGTYHSTIVHRAFTSAAHQTIECDVVLGLSNDTPAKLRNQAQNAKTPFVCFLDADDTIAVNFVEECIKTYQQGMYVYTSWYEGERVMRPRACDPFLSHDFNDGRGTIGGYHLVTTLYPTELFRAVSGFDEELKGMEDVDFYMRSASMGVCGILCDKPLLYYNDDGQRSKQFMAQSNYQESRRWIIERNGGNKTMAGCCGITSGNNQANLTGAQEGDIPVETLYAPTTQYGHPHPVTGVQRFYPRPLFMGQVIMVAPHDAEKMPQLFRPIKMLRDLAPTREQVLKESGLV